jgi:hypothetical protein
MAEIRSRLTHLENLEAIRKTLSQFCLALDAKNPALLPELFSHDCVQVVEPWSVVTNGIDEIVSFYANAFPDTRSSRNYTTNETIEMADTGYKLRCQFLNTAASPPHSIIGWGDFEDVLIEEDGLWKFKSKKITMLMLTQLDKGWADGSGLLDIHGFISD